MHNSFAWGLVSTAMLLSACSSTARNSAAVLTGGNPDRGAAYISRYGCGSCHTVPGIPGAHGLVGPSLAGIAKRFYVAGSLANQPANLEHWVQDPHSVNEKTVMPNLGVSSKDATDIAAYLYSLK